MIKLTTLIIAIIAGYWMMIKDIAKNTSVGDKHRSRMEHNETYKAEWIQSRRSPMRNDADE